MSAQEESRPYDEAIEAVRRGLNKLPRFSFLLDADGNVRRTPDQSGRWIEWSEAHQLFDPETVDGLLAEMRARAAIAKATGSAA